MKDTRKKPGRRSNERMEAMRRDIERIRQHLLAHDQVSTQWHPISADAENVRQRLLTLTGKPEMLLDELAKAVGTGANSKRAQ